MSGTLLGYVFNKALSKSIPVYITESGPGWAMCGLIIAPRLVREMLPVILGEVLATSVGVG
ncbi:hypothetical protein EMCG_06406 [[Emmonsia] crescens]|uniref:Uncharacterized protein n=1 Tax=[Emmonsia] crescens TaxID=73230 RepID=A0A0G2IB15_9EURO|nr:hypothetical protein EMCG_06406 [Emmonsia crescens UAMH 3008]